MNPLFKTRPFAHQFEVFEDSKERTYCGLAWEMGVGKSKPIIDTGAHLYAQGHITGMLITAPNDVHLNWIEPGGEIEKHLCEHLERVTASYVASPRKAEKQALERLFDPHYLGLRIASCNFESLNTQNGKAFVEKFLRLFEVLWVLDESTRIKNPKAGATKAALALAPLAKYRRILSGTMAPNRPFDLWSQYRFLDHWIFAQQKMTTFKAHYAHIRDLDPDNPYDKAILDRVPKAKRRFIQLVEKDGDGRPMYKNLDELRHRRAKYTYFKKKSECLDLPPRLYETRYVSLTATQKRMIKELHASKAAVFAEHGGDPVTALVRAVLGEDTIRAKNALGVHLREQQIVGGHAKLEKGGVIALDKNPKLESLIELLNDIDGRAIIWCRFVSEIEMIADVLSALYGSDSVATYYGATPDEDRAEVRRTFRDADSTEGARWLISNPESGGLGLTLNAANYSVWYSADFNLMHFMQGNDRNYRVGQTRSVTVFSLIAPGTIDERIMRILREKEELQASLDADPDQSINF